MLEFCHMVSRVSKPALIAKRYLLLLLPYTHSISTSATMAPVKKSKSAKNSESINSRLQLVVKSGKVGFVWLYREEIGMV
jgi:hypothetical protein